MNEPEINQDVVYDIVEAVAIISETFMQAGLKPTENVDLIREALHVLEVKT